MSKISIIEIMQRTKYYKWYVFFITFVMHEIPNLFFNTLVSLPTDFGVLALMSKLKGYDWLEIYESTGYYGNGFYILLYPIFKFANVNLFHQTALLFVVFIVSINAVICFDILSKHLMLGKTKIVIIISIMSSFVSPIRTNTMLNEHPLMLIIWLVILWSCENISIEDQNKRKFIANSCLVAVILAWSRTIHERSIMFIIAFFLAILIYFILYHQKLVYFSAFIIVFSGVSIIANKYIVYVQNTIWSSQGQFRLTNSTETLMSIPEYVPLLFSANGLKGFFNIFISLIFTGSVFSCGLLLVIFLLSIYSIKDVILLKSNNNTVKIVFLISIIMWTSIVGTLVGNSLLSLSGSINMIELNRPAKSYFIIRYYYIYLAPLLLVFASNLYRNKERILNSIKYSVILFILISFYEVFNILPMAQNHPTERLDMAHYLSAFSMRKPDEFVNETTFFFVIGIIIIFLFSYYFMTKKNKKFMFAGLLLALSIYEFGYLTIAYDYKVDLQRTNLINAFNDQIYNNKNANKQFKTIVYSEDFFSIEIVQFHFPDKKVVFESNKICEDTIILSNSMLDKETINKFNLSYKKIDENEYIYTCNSSILYYQ